VHNYPWSIKGFSIHKKPTLLRHFSHLTKEETLKFLSITIFLGLTGLHIDIAAIAVMEIMGVISFIVSFVFFKQYQRISGKQTVFLNALHRGGVSERGDGKCFSSEWVLDKIVYRPKKLLNASLLSAVIVGILFTVLFYGVFPIVFVNIASLGYATVVALIGIAIVLWTDAFEAYGYTRAIHKVATEQLDKEDQSYIELAREALRKAFLRYVSLGFAFALLGPLIPQVFNGAIYIFVLYATVFFGASEISFKASLVFGTLIVLILPGLMFFLPEFLGRFLINKGRSLAEKKFKHKVEQQ